MTTPHTIDFEALTRATDADVRVCALGAVGIAENLIGLTESLWAAQREGVKFHPDVLEAIAIVLSASRSTLNGLHLMFDQKGS
jgi:hypothetical protein